MTYIEEIASSIHRRVYPGRSLPDDDRGLYLIYAVLALTVGAEVTRNHVHDAWSAWKAMTDPGHESIRPFDELGTEVQREDEPFVAAIREAANQVKGS